MKSRVSAHLAIFSVAGLVGLLGYQRGHQETIGKTALGSPAPLSRPVPRMAADRTAAIGRLRDLARRPPLSAAVTAETWKIIRGLSADEVRQAIDSLAAELDAPSASMQAAMLYFRWAQLDPETAVTSALAYPDQNSRHAVCRAALTAWMNQDPEEAFRRAGNLVDPDSIGRMMARLLANLPPAEAMKKASSYGQEVREPTLRRLASDMSRTPENRAAFLAELERAGENDRKAGQLALLQNWGLREPLAALDQLSGLQPAEENDRVRMRILNEWARRDPATAFAWLADRPDDLPVDIRAVLYLGWFAAAPDNSAAPLDSFEKQPAGFHESVMKWLLVEAAREGWIHYGTASLESKQQQAALKSHYSRWFTSSPQQAESWLKSLEPDLRDSVLSGNSDENP